MSTEALTGPVERPEDKRRARNAWVMEQLNQSGENIDELIENAGIPVTRTKGKIEVLDRHNNKAMNDYSHVGRYVQWTTEPVPIEQAAQTDQHPDPLQTFATFTYRRWGRFGRGQLFHLAMSLEIRCVDEIGKTGLVDPEYAHKMVSASDGHWLHFYGEHHNQFDMSEVGTIGDRHSHRRYQDLVDIDKTIRGAIDYNTPKAR